MKKKWLLLIGCAGIILLAVVIYLALIHRSFDKKIVTLKAPVHQKSRIPDAHAPDSVT